MKFFRFATLGVLSIFIVAFSSACARIQKKSARIISPAGAFSKFEWSKEELQKEIAIRTLRTTPQASFHLIRLKTFEKSHTHEQHDLTVVMISGRVRVFLEEKQYEMRPGDILEVPRGKVHWAENLASSASEAYAIFTPPFDGKDTHSIKGFKNRVKSI